MSLKFNCPDCGKEIMVKYLKQGEQAKCPYCGILSAIPESAQAATLQEAAEFAGKLAGQSGAGNQILGGDLTEDPSPRQSGSIGFLRVCAWICIIGGVLFGIIMIIGGMAFSAEEDSAGPGFIMLGIFIILEAIIFGALLLVISSMADNLLIIRRRITDLCLFASKEEHTT
jgi:ribosomal protein S27E